MSGPPHHYGEGSNAPYHHHIHQNDHTHRGNCNTNGAFISNKNNPSTTSLGVGNIGDANDHTVDTRGVSNSHPTNINASFHQNYHQYPTPNTTIYPRQHQQQHHHHHHQSSTRSTTTIISGNRGYVNGRLIPPYPYPMTSPISMQPPHFGRSSLVSNSTAAASTTNTRPAASIQGTIPSTTTIHQHQQHQPHTNPSSVATNRSIGMPPPNANNEEFSSFQIGKRFYSSKSLHDAVMTGLIPILGIDKIVKLKSNKNKDPETEADFEHTRVNYHCGNCKPTVRDGPIDVPGCCGIHIGAKLVKKSVYDHAHLVITHFRVPVTSKHIMMSDSAKEQHRSTELFTHESQLTEAQTALLKVCGKRRISTHATKCVMRDVFPGLKMSTDLLWRVRNKGRSEAYGTDDQTMAMFVERGNEWKENGGSFQWFSEGLELQSWSGQNKLEKELMETYGHYSYYVDTTHSASKWDLKLGLVKVVCGLGKTAPAGTLMVPEEDGLSVHQRLLHLGFNSPDAHACTDAGGAWIYPVEEERNQSHSEDPFHLMEKAKKIRARLTNPALSQQFVDDVGKALYGMMLEEELDELLDGMLEYTSGTGLEKWTRKLASRKHKRCFVHTSKKHICAKQGGTSRCEQAYSIYKGSGTLNAEITKWSIIELMEKIESDMDHYRETCLEEFQKIILGQKGFISKYVRDIEKEETNRMLELNLEITAKEEHVDDPFHKPVVSDEGGNDDHVEDQVAAPKGTKYTMVRGDRKYKTVTVFIPDDTTLHAKSDFYRHTSFWIRCRYIQRALLDHPTRGMNDMSTLHTRWDLRRHPLYKVKYDSLVSSMQIMVGDHPVEYLPPALHPNADNADRCPLPTGTVAPPTTDVSAVVIPVPRADNGVERFKKICETSRKIEKMAKANAQVYEMAVVSLKALYDSCLTLAGSSDVAKKAAAKAIANDRNIPLVPQELLDNEGATVNMSNHSAASTHKNKSNSNAKAKANATKRKNVGDSGCSRGSTASSGAGSNHVHLSQTGTGNNSGTGGNSAGSNSAILYAVSSSHGGGGNGSANVPDGRYALATNNADSNGGVAAAVMEGGVAVGGAMASGNTCAGFHMHCHPPMVDMRMEVAPLYKGMVLVQRTTTTTLWPVILVAIKLNIILVLVLVV